VAINAMHALPDEELHDGDELALLPPMAGGAS
jgi:molybdopterin converting factor small subunit